MASLRPFISFQALRNAFISYLYQRSTARKKAIDKHAANGSETAESLVDDPMVYIS
jgi:hypothetical protein